MEASRIESRKKNVDDYTKHMISHQTIPCTPSTRVTIKVRLLRWSYREPNPGLPTHRELSKVLTAGPPRLSQVFDNSLLVFHSPLAHYS